MVLNTSPPFWRTQPAAPGTAVSIPAATAQLAALAPTVVATGHQTVTVPADAITLATLVPTVTVSQNSLIDVPIGAVRLTASVPFVEATAYVSYTITVPLAAAHLTARIPLVLAATSPVIAVPAVVATLAALAPTVTATFDSYITVPLATSSLAALVPTITGFTPQAISIPLAAASLAVLAPTVATSSNALIAVPAEAAALAGNVPILYICTPENFVSLADYYVATGSPSTFSITSGTYGSQLTIASQIGGAVSILRRDITKRTLRTVSFRCRITDTNSDDAGFITFRDVASGDYLTLTLRRESTFRVEFTWDGATTFQTVDLGATPVTVDEYYDFTFTITAATVTYSLVKVSDSSVFGSGSVANGAGEVTVSALDFYNDSGGTTTTAEFTAIEVCGELLP